MDFMLQHERALLKLEMENSSVTMKSLKEKLTGKGIPTFFEISSNIILTYKANKSIGTYDKATYIMKKLEGYVGSSNLSLSDITTIFLSKYEKYLRETLNNKTNTINKDLRF